MKAAQTMPNTWPSLYYFEIVTMSTFSSIYNFDKVKQLTSPQQDTHTQIRHPKTLSRNCLCNLLRCTSYVPSITDLLSLCFRGLHKFRFYLTHASNKPKFPDFLKTNPKEAHPTLSNESTSRQHKSSQVEQLGSSRELALFVYLGTAKLSCSPSSSTKLPSWLCALALVWTPRVTCVKHHVSWVCCAPSRIITLN
jgi:hypothetical protein